MIENKRRNDWVLAVPVLDAIDEKITESQIQYAIFKSQVQLYFSLKMREGAFAFVRNVNEAEEFVRAANNVRSGCASMIVNKTSTKERDVRRSKFRRGLIRILVSVRNPLSSS